MAVPSSICILGAGFSHVAGLPLASDLFTSQVYAASDAALRRHTAVWNDYRAWDSERGEPAELYLTRLYSQRKTWNGAKLWECAVELLGAVLATPRKVDRAATSARYLGRITSPVRNDIHDEFWRRVLESTKLRGVVTTNYDILAERGLRHRPMQRPPRPGVHYGGFPRPQVLKGQASPFTTTLDLRQVELAGSVPVFKLHGSLNWGHSASQIVMYQDLRPAFRRGGDAAILPPTAAKITPPWLSGVWDEARQALSKAGIWIVVGYSLPAYDTDVRDLLRGCAAGKDIVLMDPDSDRLSREWEAALPEALIKPLQGLPDGLQMFSRFLAGTDARAAEKAR